MPTSGAVYDRSRYFTEKMRGRTIVHGGGFARGFVVIALGGAGCLKDGSSTQVEWVTRRGTWMHISTLMR